MRPTPQTGSAEPKQAELLAGTEEPKWERSNTECFDLGRASPETKEGSSDRAMLCSKTDGAE